MLTVAEIVEEAGAPAGLGQHPADEPRARRPARRRRPLHGSCTFTGSPAVGWGMKARAGKKQVVLELGGNAGAIVDRTADLDWAVKRITVGAFAYSGQVCISVQRIFVHDDVFDAFVEQVHRGGRRRSASATRSTPRPTSGRWSTRRRRSAPRPWVDEAVAMGGRVLLGGTAERHVLRPDDPRRHAGRGEGLQRRGVRAPSSCSSASPTSTTPSAGSTRRTSACRPAGGRGLARVRVARARVGPGQGGVPAKPSPMPAPRITTGDGGRASAPASPSAAPGRSMIVLSTGRRRHGTPTAARNPASGAQEPG